MFNRLTAVAYRGRLPLIVFWAHFVADLCLRGGSVAGLFFENWEFLRNFTPITIMYLC